MAGRVGVGRPARGRFPSRLAEINVTPLVDVMLVLLIISMVAAPMLQRGLNLELPATETANEIADAAVIVAVDREARVRIDDKPVHIDLLTDRMRMLAQSRPDETVYVQADRTLQYQEVLRVMDRIRLGGIVRIALVTVPLEPESDR